MKKEMKHCILIQTILFLLVNSCLYGLYLLAGSEALYVIAIGEVGLILATIKGVMSWYGDLK